MKRFLCECGKLATWDYMPSSTYYPFFCDECVPRGCTCNSEYTVNSPQAHENGYGANPPTDHNQWKWLIPNIQWCLVDEQGRELPCVEYDYSSEGFDVTEETLSHFSKKNIDYKTE